MHLVEYVAACGMLFPNEFKLREHERRCRYCLRMIAEDTEWEEADEHCLSAKSPVANAISGCLTGSFPRDSAEGAELADFPANTCLSTTRLADQGLYSGPWKPERSH